MWIHSPSTGSRIYVKPDGGGFPLEFVLAHELFHEYVHQAGLRFASDDEEEKAANRFACEVTGFCRGFSCSSGIRPATLGLLTGLAVSLIAGALTWMKKLYR